MDSSISCKWEVHVTQSGGVCEFRKDLSSNRATAFFCRSVNTNPRARRVLGRCPRCCSARVSRVGLSEIQKSTQQKPSSDNLLNRSRNPSGPYSDKAIPLSFETVALLLGLSTGSPPKVVSFTAWSHTRNRTRTPPEKFHACLYWKCKNWPGPV